jgi:Flp pilus assembly protein TadG
MRKTRTDRRKAFTVPFMAILLVPLLAMMAFSIDIGWAVQVRAELANATDSATLAGVEQLYGAYQNWKYAGSAANKQTIYNNAISCTKATVAAVAGSTKAGNVSVQLASSDIDVGYTNANGTFYSGNANQIPAGKFPNTVVVTGRRDNTNLPSTNGELPLFFGPVLGTKTLPLTASSTAVAYGGTISNFAPPPKPVGSFGPNFATSGSGSGSGSGNGSGSGTGTGTGTAYGSSPPPGSTAGPPTSNAMPTLLPVAVNITEWSDFYQNGVNSQYADPNAPTGSAWFQIYPGGTGECMDGLLSLNGSKAASQQNYSGPPPGGGWIQCGPTWTDIQGLQAAGDLPLPSNGSGACWAAGPGMKSSLLSDWQALITNPPIPRLLPLFDPNSPGTTGSGNGTYQICYFVPVYVIYAQGNGLVAQDIAVIPAPGYPVTDPTVVMKNVAPLGSSTVPAQYEVPIGGKIVK